MQTFSGRGGIVYALGEPYEFKDLPLRDCGTGWDWETPEELGCWLMEGLSFEVCRQGKWDGIGAVEMYHCSGRVGFGRCLSGLDVRATGTCLPASLVCSGETWQIDVEAIVRNSTVLGADAVQTTGRPVGATATVRGETTDHVVHALTRLPMAYGAFVGTGIASCWPGQVQVKFDTEGVQYVPR